MSPGAWGQAVAGFVVGIGRAIRDRVRQRRRINATPVRRAWIEQRQGLWYVRRADGLLWTGNGWSYIGSSYRRRDIAEEALDALVAVGLVSRIPG